MDGITGRLKIYWKPMGEVPCSLRKLGDTLLRKGPGGHVFPSNMHCLLAYSLPPEKVWPPPEDQVELLVISEAALISVSL